MRYEVEPFQHYRNGCEVLIRKIRPVYEWERAPVAFIAPIPDSITEHQMRVWTVNTIGL